jgi:hypothetical protein
VGAQLNRSGGGIVAADRAEPQIGALQHVSQRSHHVTGFQQAGRRLRQERRVEHEVDVVDELQPRRLLRQQRLEPPRDRHPSKPTAGDDHVRSHALSIT